MRPSPVPDRKKKPPAGRPGAEILESDTLRVFSCLLAVRPTRPASRSPNKKPRAGRWRGAGLLPVNWLSFFPSSPERRPTRPSRPLPSSRAEGDGDVGHGSRSEAPLGPSPHHTPTKRCRLPVGPVHVYVCNTGDEGPGTTTTVTVPMIRVKPSSCVAVNVMSIGYRDRASKLESQWSHAVVHR